MLVIPGLRFFVKVTSSSIDSTTSATWWEREGERESRERERKRGRKRERGK